MGVDMSVYGGMIGFTDLSTEAVTKVTAALDKGDYEASDPYRMADYSDSTSWHQLFAAFKLGLIPSDRGLYTVVGLNDRYYDPTFLLREAAEFISDGSWLVWSTVEALYIAVFSGDGKVAIRILPETETAPDEPGYLWLPARLGHHASLNAGFMHASSLGKRVFEPGELPQWVLDNEQRDGQWFIQWATRYNPDSL